MTCIACYTHGQCTGVCGKNDTPHSEATRRAVQKAMTEKILSGYIRLSCGDLTTYEAQAHYSAFRPKGKDYFCEIHGHWVMRKPEESVKPLPDQPEF